jgi:putative YphP/YqiW family bacilliredoxin
MGHIQQISLGLETGREPAFATHPLHRALPRDGDAAFMLERHQIEGRSADAIAHDLAGAFEQYC